ncbi:MAG TPA: GGDEF domain-containing protein [Terriglobales bacterium]|nr:GGDEF domain-containing protein [Terriglobales bacterium]
MLTIANRVLCARGSMSQVRQDQPSMLARAEEIQRQIHDLSSRDTQLWSIVSLVILILTGGFLAVVFPNMLWAQRVFRVQQAYLPQLFFGLICLVVLLNIYFLSQRVALNSTRKALISELVLNERLESLSLVDPLTQLLNRRALNELISHQLARANRNGEPLTFLVLDINQFRELNAKLGSMEGNRVLTEFAKILKSVFRGGDLIFRQGGDEFLVVMPDTSEPQAEAPLQRLLRVVEEWNITNDKAYQLSFAWGLAGYITGTSLEEILRTVDRKLYQKMHNLAPVF